MSSELIALERLQLELSEKGTDETFFHYAGNITATIGIDAFLASRQREGMAEKIDKTQVQFYEFLDSFRSRPYAETAAVNLNTMRNFDSWRSYRWSANLHIVDGVVGYIQMIKKLKVENLPEIRTEPLGVQKVEIRVVSDPGYTA